MCVYIYTNINAVPRVFLDISAHIADAYFNETKESYHSWDLCKIFFLQFGVSRLA